MYDLVQHHYYFQLGFLLLFFFVHASIYGHIAHRHGGACEVLTEKGKDGIEHTVFLLFTLVPLYVDFGRSLFGLE